MKHWKFLLITGMVVAAAGLAVIFRGELTGLTARLAELRERTGLALNEIRKEIIAPPPLRNEDVQPAANLTRAGVIEWTNRQRSNNDLGSLAENAKLNAAAEGKLADLFAKQYFDHVSPSGAGPSFWAEQSGYSYLVLGENLALGDYDDDQALVQAWMDSPGHRANILDRRFADIGVAVGKGNFEGRTTWIAVQEFGKPTAACSPPSAALKADIDDNNQALDLLQANINSLRAELDSSRRRDRQEYNANVARYNAYVSEYNALLEATKALVARYNAQVAAFNECIGQ